MLVQNVTSIIAILPFKFHESEPRHHNFHLSLDKSGSEVTFITLRDQSIFSPQQNNLLPKSSTWGQPIFGFGTFMKFRAHLERAKTHRRYACYIYEGSFSWAFLLAAINYFGRMQMHFVVNIFPSQDFFAKHFTYSNSQYFKISFLLFLLDRLRDMKVYVTFDNKDARIIPRELVCKINEFPLFSSISKVSKQIHSMDSHSNVLILERNYTIQDLSFLISESCKQCNFYIARSDSMSFNSATNFHLFPQVIPVNQYSTVLGKFDYVIFLYDVENNSSGKILDFCQLSTPVCIPKGANYLLRIAQNSVPYLDFSLGNPLSLKTLFNHPTFKMPNSGTNWGPESFPSRLLALTEKENNELCRRSILRFFFAATLLVCISITRSIFVLRLIYSRLRSFLQMFKFNIF